MDPDRISLRCESDHESPWSQFIADTEGRFSPMHLSLPRNFSPLTPVDMTEGSFCSSKFSPTSCFPPPAKKRAVRCVYHQKDHNEHYHLAIDIDPIGIEASRVSSESSGTQYNSPIDHVWGYNFSPYNDHVDDDDHNNIVIHDVSPLYSRAAQPAPVRDNRGTRDTRDNRDTRETPKKHEILVESRGRDGRDGRDEGRDGSRDGREGRDFREGRDGRESIAMSLDAEADGTEDLKTNKKQFEDSVTSLLTTWILDNQMDPYPTQSEKERLAGLSGLSLQQVTDWLTNTRKRHLFPVISGRKVAKSALEKMFLHQAILVAKTQ